MKLSCEDMNGNDPEKALLASRAHVYLNGKRINACLEANEEGCYVICYKLDENGLFILNSNGDSFKTERRYGKVEIIDPEKQQ